MTRAGPLPVGFMELDHVLRGEAEAHMLPEPRRFPIRPPGMAEQPASMFELAQQLEEVERLGQRLGPA